MLNLVNFSPGVAGGCAIVKVTLIGLPAMHDDGGGGMTAGC